MKPRLKPTEVGRTSRSDAGVTAELRAPLAHNKAVLDAYTRARKERLAREQARLRARVEADAYMVARDAYRLDGAA